MPDYIIVGGGAAGCVLAARLSEKADVSVLLLEAGPQDTDRYIHWPVGFFKMTAGPLIWGYDTVPGREIEGRTIVYPQARVLGGGSSINAQVFTRGCPQDYDDWAKEEGCDGWSYADVLPYFRRSEGNDTFAGPHHGIDGPQGISSGSPHPLTRAFVRAAQQAGLPFRADFNAGEQEGVGFYQTFTRGGKRCSTVVGYLRPALSRPNLTLRTDVTVLRVVLEKGRAVGVEVASGAGTEIIRADREVIVTAGAIGSPKLLMLSGIGPADHLAQVGVKPVHDLPGVGQNLHDHINFDVIAELSGSYGIDRYKKKRWQAMAGLEYVLFGKGPVASNIVEAGGFWWGDRSEKTPDIQFHFLPGAGVEEGIGSVPSGNGCTLNSYHVRPRSRGSVTLRSSNFADAPLIDPNALAERYDVERIIDGIEISREILAQPALSRMIAREHLPGRGVVGRRELEKLARQYARSAYHPVGTCRMGVGEDAVVGPDLRLRGIEGLRVCDSSVMPRVVSSNTNAATIMVAEKASDLILQ
ncbi:GMC family oxidoreductase N-terminal domain-containing protein [Mesorhizobium sp. VNQ89]|uniref:GMC family oxidoreductase n=1 Tax=Mesorhizobium quangtriensis TaxID=3157709 RepID=UPI0032B85467